MNSVAVLMQFETADPRLSGAAVEAAMKSAGGVAQLRRTVLQLLLKKNGRVVAIMPAEHARLLMLLHEAVGEELSGEPVALRPPLDYIPPTTE